MSLPLEADDSGITYYYTSGVGSILTFLVIIILCLHSVHDYIISKERNKMIYILYFLICLVSMFICIQYAFIQSNLFTGQSVSDFTKFQCAFSEFCSLSGVIIGSMCVYTFLIVRIAIGFKDSIYELSKRLLYTLHIVLFIGSAGCLIFLCIALPQYRFVLYYFGSTKHLFCTAEQDPSHPLPVYRHNYIGAVLFVSLQISYNVILLYLFTKRLYALQTEMVLQHLEERYDMKLRNTKTLKVVPMDEEMAGASDGQSIAIQQGHEEDTGIVVTSPNMISVGSVIDEAKRKNDFSALSAQRIMNFHELIKKHTILMIIIICSSLIWLALNYFVSDWFWIEIAWLLLINNICIWLMFNHSQRYWICATNYCFCYVCYHSDCCTKKNIQSRTCGFFLLTYTC
eukprot:1148292_1